MYKIIKSNPHLTPYTKIHSALNSQHLRAKTIKFLEENIGVFFIAMNYSLNSLNIFIAMNY